MAREQVKRKKGEDAQPLARGVLIRSGARVERDAWIVLEDDAEAPQSGDIVVSVARFKAERDALLSRKGRLGVTIAPADAVEDIGADAPLLAVIMVQFPVFRDGRGFTTAQLLRQRYHYRGELRAVGDVLEDQIFFMLRSGFDAFEILAADPLAAYARAARVFSFGYQPTGDGFVPVHRLRARRALEQAAE
ncbi:MAG TPA: DUF934 domain-containing protein [Caulobacterales bacterium]|nr:DUF934 domain-containing protein [Caulobacterales bacterium]